MPGKNQVVAQVKQFWSSRTSNQRLTLGIGVVAAISVLAFFANLIAKPDYKPLVNALEPADAQSIAADLTAKKIAFQLSPDGKSISVPADQVDAARLEIAGNQSTRSGRLGFEIFDKVSWGQTEFDEKVNYQRALEGELERTIMTLAAVKSSRVHLVMATDSVFLDRERSAKASVTLKLGRGGLTRDETRSIQRLVAGAVDGLKPDDVSIIDADSDQAVGGSGDSSPGEEGMERELTQRLVATLSPVVGAGRLRASVNVEYDPGTVEENQDKYDPAVSVPLTVQRSDETNGMGAGVGGVAGTTSNVPVTTKANVPPPTGDESSQSSKTENTTYGVNRTTSHTVQPAGRIRRISAALIIDDGVLRKQEPSGKWIETPLKRSASDMQQITQLATAAIGLDKTRGDVISVQNLAFAHNQEADAPKPSIFDKTRKGLSDYSTIVRYAMLLVLFAMAYLLMIRPMQKKVLATEVHVPAPVELAELSTVPGLPSAGSSLNEMHRTLALKDLLVQQVKTEPASSARLVQAWLRAGAE